MSTLKVNKIRDTAGSADAIVLDPSGGAKIAGVCTATSFVGQIPAASIVGVCTSGLTKTGGFGKIVQVVSTTKTDTFSESLSQGAISADAISLAITPTSSSNKILITASCTMCSGGNGYQRLSIVFYKAGSVLTGATGDADGSKQRVSFNATTNASARPTCVGGQYLDTAGGTSSITYSVRLAHGYAGTATVYLNRAHSESDYNYYHRGTSTITLTEIEA